tara:strand:- start:77 stop:403 length:327 start_codon:yes stop_codon:yes gene_type:complete
MADRLLVQKTAVTDAAGEVVLTGVSGDSQTVISISICETAGADEIFSLVHCVSGGGSPFNIYKDQPLPAKSTFVHPDKIVVDDTDQLMVLMGGACTVHVLVSYLQQDD